MCKLFVSFVGWQPNNSFKPTPCRGVGYVLYATLARVRRPATGRLNSSVRPQENMTISAINEMKDRISRALITAQRASGYGYQVSYKAYPQEFTTNFNAEGVKSPEQIEDDFLSLFVWVWSLKDYIKSAFIAHGLQGEIVEHEVNSCPALTYVADIANRTKHGTLNKSRSGQHAELVDVGFTVPQSAIQRITFAGPNLTLEVSTPEQVEIHAWVVTKSGVRTEALDILTQAMNCWEGKLLPQIAA